MGKATDKFGNLINDNPGYFSDITWIRNGGKEMNIPERSKIKGIILKTSSVQDAIKRLSMAKAKGEGKIYSIVRSQ